jgi:hypothetical protein
MGLGSMIRVALSSVGITQRRYIAFRQFFDPSFKRCPCPANERAINRWYFTSPLAKPLRGWLENYRHNGVLFWRVIKHRADDNRPRWFRGFRP